MRLFCDYNVKKDDGRGSVGAVYEPGCIGKAVQGDKPYLGNKSLRVQSDEAAGTKIMIEFISLIVRCRIYTLLKDEMERLEKTRIM